MTLLVVDDPRARARALLPSSLRPLPGAGGRYLLVFSQFTRVRPVHAEPSEGVSYDETAPFIPCLSSRLRPSVFCPEIYPSSELAVSIGRELYGFSKRIGQTFQPDPRSFRLVVDGQALLEARWLSERPIPFSEFTAASAAALQGRPAFRHLGGLVGRVMSLRSGSRLWPRVMVLSRSGDASAVFELPFRLRSVEKVRALEAPSLEFLSPELPLAGQAVAGFALSVSFEFGEGA